MGFFERWFGWAAPKHMPCYGAVRRADPPSRAPRRSPTDAPTLTALITRDEIVKEFLVENYENLDRLDRDLVSLEKDPHSKEHLASIFRTIHTLKGTSGFLGFGKLEAIAHVGENLLSKMRDGIFTINPEIASALLATVDAVRFMLGQIEATDEPGDRDYSGLIEELARLNEGKNIPAALAIIAAPPVSRATDDVAAAAPPPPIVAPPQAPAELAALALERTPVAVAAALPPAGESPALPRAGVRAEGGPVPAETPEPRTAGVSDSTIRVDVGLLDKLMNLVGELVLARNQVLQFTGQYADSSFLATSQRLI